VSDKYAGMLLLYLDRHARTYWTWKMFKRELNLDLELEQIRQKLVTLSGADVVGQGVTDVDFRGL
jgi:hypothetical protein